MFYLTLSSVFIPYVFILMQPAYSAPFRLSPGFVQQTHNLLCTKQTKFLPYVFEFPYVLSAVLQSSDAAKYLVPKTQSVVLIFGALHFILNLTLGLLWDLSAIHWWSVTIWPWISVSQNFATRLSNLGI